VTGFRRRLEHEAVELWAPESVSSPFVLTCEHASERLPAGWTWQAVDARLHGTHWAFDLGAAEATLALAERLGAPAVLARFTRLLIDANRPLDSDTLLRPMADGVPIALGAHVTEDDKRRRIDGYYAPFHAAVDSALAASRTAQIVLSMHSFTPLYEGQPRSVEVGVLFDEDPELGEELFRALDDGRYDLRRNEPWSGYGGLMYSPQSHARRFGLRAVELELRQDLATQAAWRDELVERVATALEATTAR